MLGVTRFVPFHRVVLCCLLALALLALTATPVSAQSIEFKDVEGKHLDIVRDGKPLIRYMYAFDTSTPELRHETYKVYHHVFDPSGEKLLTKGAGGKFTHHRGLFIGFSRTNYDGKTYDLWHMKDKCSLVHEQVLEQAVNDESATLSTRIRWEIAPGKPILSETRTLKVWLKSDAHVLVDWMSELKTVDGDVVLKSDPEHGGMQYRPSNEVAENKSAKYLFQREGVDPKKDKDLDWVALTYALGKKKYSVQHMRHPNNPKDSVYSAYRDYGRFGNYFVHKIPAGESLKLAYRFRIDEGAAATRETCQARFDQFVQP